MAYTTALDEHPEFAALLGRLVGQWGALEHALIAVLARLLNIDFRPAKMVFNTFPALTQKIGLLERLSKNFFEANDAREKLLALLKETYAANDKRNEYVHALWLNSDADELHVQSISLQSIAKHLEAKAILPADVEKLRAAVTFHSELLSKFLYFQRNDAPLLVALPIQ